MGSLHVEKGTSIDRIKVDLRLSVMKELEAMWLVSAFDYFNSNSNIVSNGFKKAGITDAIEGQQRELLSDEDPFNDLED